MALADYFLATRLPSRKYSRGFNATPSSKGWRVSEWL